MSFNLNIGGEQAAKSDFDPQAGFCSEFCRSDSTNVEAAMEMALYQIGSCWWWKYKAMKQVLSKAEQCYLAAKSQ